MQAGAAAGDVLTLGQKVTGNGKYSGPVNGNWFDGTTTLGNFTPSAPGLYRIDWEATTPHGVATAPSLSFYRGNVYLQDGGFSGGTVGEPNDIISVDTFLTVRTTDPVSVDASISWYDEYDGSATYPYEVTVSKIDDSEIITPTGNVFNLPASPSEGDGIAKLAYTPAESGWYTATTPKSWACLFTTEEGSVGSYVERGCYLESGKTYYFIYSYPSLSSGSSQITMSKMADFPALSADGPLASSAMVPSSDGKRYFASFTPDFTGTFDFTAAPTTASSVSSDLWIGDEQGHVITQSFSYPVTAELEKGKTYVLSGSCTDRENWEPTGFTLSVSGTKDSPATLNDAVLDQAKTYGLLAYTSGIETTAPLTRLEMVNLLAGFMGAEIDTTAEVTLAFTDCDDLTTKQKAVLKWTVDQGFVAGKGNNTFGPYDRITRAEVAAILDRMLTSASTSGQGKRFTDVTEEKWYYESVNHIADRGIFTTESGTFDPNAQAAFYDVTRWLVAAYEYKTNQAVSTIDISATASVKAGESATLTPTITPAITGAECVWNSDNASVATVKNGEVTGVKAGTATITVQLANGNSASCTVTVPGSTTPVVPSGPSGGGSSTPTTPDPVITENPDGSTTTTETAEDGTVTATTTWDDGQQAVAVKSPEGEKIITVTTAAGEKVADVKLPAQPATPKVFEDVKDDGWYKNAVDTATGYGLFNGTSETKFSPNDGMTRGMLATVLYNLSGKPEYGTDAGAFNDVETGKWYEDPVDWAYKVGVTSGTSATEFSPNKDITREQLVTMLYRYAEKIGAASSSRKAITGFPDGNKVAGYAKDAMQWAVAEGFISGRAQGSKNYIVPQGTASRAEVATVLAKFVEYLKK